jgi:hypothetical protein
LLLDRVAKSVELIVALDMTPTDYSLHQLACLLRGANLPRLHQHNTE